MSTHSVTRTFGTLSHIHPSLVRMCILTCSGTKSNVQIFVQYKDLEKKKGPNAHAALVRRAPK